MCWLLPDRFPRVLLVQPDRRASGSEVHAVVPCMRPLGRARADRILTKVDVRRWQPADAHRHVAVAGTLDSKQRFTGSIGDTAHLERRFDFLFRSSPFVSDSFVQIRCNRFDLQAFFRRQFIITGATVGSFRSTNMAPSPFRLLPLRGTRPERHRRAAIRGSSSASSSIPGRGRQCQTSEWVRCPSPTIQRQRETVGIEHVHGYCPGTICGFRRCATFFFGHVIKWLSKWLRSADIARNASRRKAVSSRRRHHGNSRAACEDCRSPDARRSVLADGSDGHSGPAVSGWPACHVRS